MERRKTREKRICRNGRGKKQEAIEKEIRKKRKKDEGKQRKTIGEKHTRMEKDEARLRIVRRDRRYPSYHSSIKDV